MATPWLAWSAFLTETDLICLEAGTIFSREQLAIAAWSEERDQERMGYRTQLGTMDIVVWHTTEGAKREPPFFPRAMVYLPRTAQSAPGPRVRLVLRQKGRGSALHLC